MSTDIDKIVGIINQQALGNDPQKVAEVVFKKIETFDNEKFLDVIKGLADSGSLEVAVHLISDKRADAAKLVVDLFEHLKAEKFYDDKVVNHFNVLVKSKGYGSAKQFILTVENDYFAALEQIGFFGEEVDAMSAFDNALSSEDKSPSESDETAAGSDENADSSETVGSESDSLLTDCATPESLEALVGQLPETDPLSSVLDEEEPENFETDLEVQHIFETLFEEIFADGIVTDVERRFIGELRRVFRISQADYKRLYMEADEKYKKGLLHGKDDADPLKIYERIVAKAFEDNVLTTEEEDILFSVAQTLFIDMDTHLELIKKYSNK